MSLDGDYLKYARRGYGMDHDHYDWSMLADRAPVTWPGNKPLALWVNVALQFFPLDQKGKPFPPPGGMVTAYPALRHFTLSGSVSAGTWTACITVVWTRPKSASVSRGRSTCCAARPDSRSKAG